MYSVTFVTRCCCSCSDPLEVVRAARRAQKVAAGKALSSAFQKILLVVLGTAQLCTEHRGVWADGLTSSVTVDRNSFSLNFPWDSSRLGAQRT